MSGFRSVALAIAHLIVVPVALFAQTPSLGDWSVVDAQPTGTAVVLETIGAQTFTGRIVAVRAVDLTLALEGGEQRDIPKSAVIEVRTRERQFDSLGNGMTRGGLIGAAVMVSLVAVLYANCELTCDAPSVRSVLLPALAIGTGAGIGAGAALDAAIKRPLILFRARRP